MSYTNNPKPKLRAGKKIKVFQKPLTDEDFEDIAVLVKFDSVSEGYDTERWMVRFANETELYPRDVKPQNLVK